MNGNARFSYDIDSWFEPSDQAFSFFIRYFLK